MKKLLFSVLAGFTIIGSGYAVPDEGDRKELCDLLIQKGTHVWVEKTKACIPVNPCASKDEDIRKAYCIAKELHLYDDDQIQIFADRYAKNVLKTTVDRVNYELPDKSAFAITTADKGYYAAEYISKETRNNVAKCSEEAATAAYAYNQRLMQTTSDSKSATLVTQYEITEDECNNIKDFENLLYIKDSTKVYYDSTKKTCTFACSK